MSSNIYDILNKFNSLDSKPEPKVEQQPKAKTRLQESIDTVSEKYMGFKKLEKSIAAKGDVRDPAAVAAAIGRKKYGKEKFQKAAAKGKKLGEEVDTGEADARKTSPSSKESQKKTFDKFRERLKKEKAEDDKMKKKGVAEGSLEAETPNPVVVIQDLKGKILDTVNLSTAVQKYKLGKPQDIKNQLAHQNYTTIGNYVVASPMAGQPQDNTTKNMAEGSGDKSFEDMNRAELLDYLNMSPKEAADMTNKDLRDACQEKTKDVSEVAPPGAKAERMVKHIKKGYAKDGKLTDKERSIAYATAWKAHKAGKVEEAAQALQTLVAAGMTAEQITEGWDDMLKAVEKRHKELKDKEGTGKFDKTKISTGTVYTRKYDADGMSNTDDEVKPEGEKRKRGRPKKSAFESKSTAEKMIAEAYTAEGGPQLVDIPAYQRKAAGQNFPIKIADLEPKGVISSKQGLADLKDKLGMQEEDEVSAREPEDMKEDSQLSYEQDLLKKGVGDQMYNEIEAALQDPNFNLTANEPLYHALYDYYTDNNEMPYDVVKARTDTPDEWIMNKMQELFGNTDQEQQGPEDSNMDKELAEMMRLAGMQAETKMSEADMEEGNEFTAARVAAIKAGKDSFEVDGKTYKVTGDTSDEKKMEEAVTEGEECPKCHCDPCECDDDDDKEKMDECGPGYEMDQGQEGRMNVSTNMSSDGNKSVTITADGEAAEELMQMLALAGMKAQQPMPQEENVHQQMAAVEEEKDPRYQASTTPEEEVMPVQVQTKGGNGEVAGKEKAMHKDGAARFSDNPLAMKESMDDLSNMGRDLMKQYNSIKVQK